MRTSSTSGTASSRLAAVVRPLAAGLLAVGLATLAVQPASALASTGGHWGDRWDGGSASTGGRTYSWPDGSTYDVDDDVCPGMDTAHVTPSGDPTTVELVAPEGELISAYCLKAGSRQATLRAAADGLPLTGAQLLTTVLAAAAMTALGTVGVVVARRRRAASVR